MSPRPKALISWSSGKDSAFALHEVRRSGEFEVVGALTTVTEAFGKRRLTTYAATINVVIPGRE
jgi:diphthamide synthase (EF-2-diphthine--ammonia ligase)